MKQLPLFSGFAILVAVLAMVDANNCSPGLLAACVIDAIQRRIGTELRRSADETGARDPVVRAVSSTNDIRDCGPKRLSSPSAT